MILKDTASIQRASDYTKNEIGEKIPIYETIGSTRIRVYTTSSMYPRTTTGYVSLDTKRAILPYSVDIRKGDKVIHRSNEYLVTGINDDGMGIFLNITME